MWLQAMYHAADLFVLLFSNKITFRVKASIYDVQRRAVLIRCLPVNRKGFLLFLSEKINEGVAGDRKQPCAKSK